MKTRIALSGNQVFSVYIATRALAEGGLMQFAWAYVSGETGSAVVQIIDTNGVPQSESQVPVPGVFATVVRESSPPNKSIILVKAGENGFLGEFTFDLLQVSR
jgi:hypothetical protein